MKNRVNFKNPLATKILANSLKPYLNRDVIIICIGTDKFIGDSLGPLIGSLLKSSSFPYPVYGTLHEPIHALNLSDSMKIIKKKHPDSFLIGIDACLGHKINVGDIHIRNHPIYPGKGVGKSLPSVGDISITGIVDFNSNEDFFESMSIRLSFVYDLANKISSSFLLALDLDTPTWLEEF